MKNLVMECTPIIFEHKGKQYTEVLCEVAEAGRPNVQYLMIENFYYGSLTAH